MEVKATLTEKAQRDYELIQRAVLNHDQKAYAELMDNYRDSLYFMMLKMTNSPYDAEDLTIEAFGKAFKRIQQYTPNYAFSTWLFKIASNNCIDFLRKKRNQFISIDSPYDNPDDDYSLEISSSDMSPEETFIEKQKGIMMRSIVERLKPHYKNLVELRYFKEYSYEEIAEELSLPLGTVKAQLFRARNLLYNMMKNKAESI
ncbi:MAG: sigma-70 family RNA polymerase sigma factor [Bacteroidales bacterium]|nr:sigma-70 family RNA polymerase sigma factor [Bacteroidales bacterium]